MRRKKDMSGNDNKYNYDADENTPILLNFKDTFKTYRPLLSKSELIKFYPWCNERITYNYVFTSYRRPNNSSKTCLLSLFMVHNELVNQWTHIIGAITVLCLLIITLTTVTNIEATVVLSLYCIIGFFMFSCSVSYHIFCCHSDNGSRVVQCMDWLGIAVMTFACNLVVSYYELRDYRTAFYLFTSFNLVFGIISYGITFSALSTLYLSADIQKGLKTNKERTVVPSFLRPLVAIMETYAFRTFVGVFYALGCIIAWFIGYLLRGYVNEDLFWILCMYACYFTVALCLLDLPEKLAPPGTFDILGYSHQLFHVGIIAGVVLEWAYFYDVQIKSQ